MSPPGFDSEASLYTGMGTAHGPMRDGTARCTFAFMTDFK